MEGIKRGKTGWKEGGREGRKKENKLNWPFEQAVSIASGRGESYRFSEAAIFLPYNEISKTQRS